MDSTGANEAELWQRLKGGRREEALSQLVSRYRPWAAAMARNIHRRVPAYPVDCEDFIQNAQIGLLEAIDRYEPSRGIPFQAFAKPRVRGAVFNGIRAIFGERLAPAREARFSERLDSLQQAPGADVFDTLVDAIVGLGLGYMLDASSPSEGPSGYTQTMQEHRRLSAAVSSLPARLRNVIERHYYQFVPFVEIASEAGVTKGRISQLHHEALRQLRVMLEGSRTVGGGAEGL